MANETILNRTGLIGGKVETAEGTAETLDATHFQGKFKDQTHDYDPGEYDRAIVTATLSKTGFLKGTRMGGIGFTMELNGGGASTAAPWHTFLRGCGFTAGTALKTIGVGSRSGGEYVVGQLIGNNATFGSATKTGRVVAILERGSTDQIVLEPITGNFAAADTIYNYATSQVSATASGTLSNAGFAFTPMSQTAAQTPPSLTLERRIGGQIHRLVAARGKATLSFKVNEPALLKFEFMGCPVLDNNGRPTADSSPITGIADVGAAPRLSKSLPVRFDPGGSNQKTPVLTELSVEVNNTLAPRDTISDVDYVSSGYVGVRIGDREITVSMEPDNDLSDNKLDLVAKTMITQTFGLSLAIGSEQDANGLLVVYAGAAQLKGQHTPGDRNGIQNASVQAILTGVDDGEQRLYHVFVA